MAKRMNWNIQPDYKDVEDRIDLEPFAKTNWKTKESREQFKELQRLGSQAKAEAEWRSVMDGETDRKAAIIHVRDQNREEWIERVGEHGLHFKPIKYTQPFNGFAHKHHPTTKSDPNRITYAAIAEEEKYVDQFYDAEHENHTDHNTVGRLLGFPECCRRFFDEVWMGNGDIGRKLDPMYEITCNSENVESIDGDPNQLKVVTPNPGANILWKHYGMSFLTHIPCSWDCEHSIEIARNRYRIMVENGYEEVANLMSEWLSLPAEWTGYHAIGEIRNRHMTASSKTSNYWRKKRIVWKDKHKAGGSIV